MPARKLGCQPHILSLFSDCNGKEFIRDNDLHRVVDFIDYHSGYFSRSQCIANEFSRVYVPGNDVYFFTPQFLHHVLDPTAFHAHAGTDRINIGVV